MRSRTPKRSSGKNPGEPYTESAVSRELRAELAEIGADLAKVADRLEDLQKRASKAEKASKPYVVLDRHSYKLEEFIHGAVEEIAKGVRGFAREASEDARDGELFGRLVAMVEDDRECLAARSRAARIRSLVSEAAQLVRETRRRPHHNYPPDVTQEARQILAGLEAGPLARATS